MGLGLLGRGVGDAQFLADCGAELIVTDLKTEKQLATSLKKLAKYKNIKYTLGEHKLEDFRNRDLIIKAAGVPLDSIFIAEAEKSGVPVTMSTALFAKLAPATLVGVTGTRGKTTVTNLIYEIAKTAFDKGQNGRVFLGGNIKGISTLALLKKNLKPEDLIVLELDSWQLQGFGTEKISPRIAVFTNLLVDHQNYYHGSMVQYFSDKANIYRHQTSADSIIAGNEVAKKIKADKPKGRLTTISVKDFPQTWQTRLLGEHNKQNLALALAAARALNIPDAISKQVIKNFSAVPGRLQLVREKDEIKFYNDTTATTPDGAIAALLALEIAYPKKKIALLAGGNDKELDFRAYAKRLKSAPLRTLILFKGTATDKILKLLPKKSAWPIFVVDSMPNAFAMALSYAERGDLVLLSPGATSFGIFKNEYDRGDQFVRACKKI